LILFSSLPLPGCSAVGSALGSGPRGPGFKSPHPERVSEVIRKRYIFVGRVQGVGFRFFCRDAAKSRGVRGWVRNLPDGNVELEAESDELTLIGLRNRIAQGNGWSRVDRVECVSMTPRGVDEEGFEVTY
jgi:acylphosphatase